MVRAAARGAEADVEQDHAPRPAAAGLGVGGTLGDLRQRLGGAQAEPVGEHPHGDEGGRLGGRGVDALAAGVRVAARIMGGRRVGRRRRDHAALGPVQDDEWVGTVRVGAVAVRDGGWVQALAVHPDTLLHPPSGAADSLEGAPSRGPTPPPRTRPTPQKET